MRTASKRPQGGLSEKVIFSKGCKETELASDTEYWVEGRWWGEPVQGPWGLLPLQNSRSQQGVARWMRESRKL